MLIFLPYVQGNPQIDLQDKGVIDSGCSRHMTGNISYLIDYKEIDGGYVAFGAPNFKLIDESQVLLRVPRKNNIGKNVDEDPSKGSECRDQEQDDNVNSSNNVNAASTNGVNDVSENISNFLLFDPNMPALEDISTFNFSSDHEDDDQEANINNLDTTIQVSPVPTTRIIKIILLIK
nr:ribonuclease H-like domain-containing protein [Tanacetum cinerariifolium]